MGPGGGQARVFLASSVTSSPSILGSDFISEEGGLTLAAIDSLWVTITAVEAVKAGGDSAAGGWQSIQLDSGSLSRINLMALPTEGADSMRLARGELKAGTYDHIRLRIADSATIVLKQDVSFGQSNMIVKGSYPVRIPSGQQTGLKIKTASFVVGEDSAKAVTLVFDGATSLGTVIVTGNGRLQMSPVLRSRTP
jgi:hypothetical protein